MRDGSRVSTREEWNKQRNYLKQMLAHYLYGQMPPRPKQVEIEKVSTADFGSGKAVEEHYTLTISSEACGSVTEPGEGVFTYDAGTVVSLVATPARRYEFSGWTGDVGMIANGNSASTTITMYGNYSITANFQRVRRTL